MFDFNFDFSSSLVLKYIQTHEGLCELSSLVFLDGGSDWGLLALFVKSEMVIMLPSEGRGRLEAMITDENVPKRGTCSMLSHTARKK